MLKYIGNKKPVILVSRKFSELASWTNIPNEYGVIVIDYFGWPELFNAAGKIKDNNLKVTTIFRIINSLNKHYKLTNSKKESDENVTILLLSDLQFGDPDFSEDTLLSEFNLSSYLGENHIIPDFIFILGDITYSAEPSQFNKALDWINTLCQKIFQKDFEAINERVFIVPGNHDINLTLSSGSFYEYNFNGIAQKDYLKQRDKVMNENKVFGIYPFCDFAFRLTKDDRWINKVNNLCWITDRFINWGLRIITLNSVSELSYEDPKHFEINEDALRNISKNDENSINDLFTIILAHNGPEDLGYERGKDADKKAKNLFSLINTIRGNLFIHGHRHEASDKYEISYKGKYTSSIRYIMVGTYNLNSVLRKQDSRRSFSVLELERENSKIIDSHVKIFEIEEQNIREISNS